MEHKQEVLFTELFTHMKSLVVTFESSSALTTALVTMKVNTPVSPPVAAAVEMGASLRRRKRWSSAIFANCKCSCSSDCYCYIG